MDASNDRRTQPLSAGLAQGNGQTGAGDAGHSGDRIRSETRLVGAAAETAKPKSGYFGSRHTDGGLSGVTVIVGQPGCGKTFLTLKLIRTCRRAIFVDSVANIGSGPRQNPLPGFTIVQGLFALRAYLLKHGGGKFRIVYRPGTPGLDDEQEFDALCLMVKWLRDTVLAVDEIWRYCSPGWMSPALRELIFAGRHSGTTVIAIAQRPQKIAKDLLSAATSYKVFRLAGGLERDALRIHAGVPDEVLDQIAVLPDRQYFARDEYLNWKRS